MSRTNSTMLRSEKAIQAAVGSGDASRNLSTVMISFSSAAKRDAAEFTGVEDRVWQDSNAVLECQSAHCQGKTTKFGLFNRKHHCRQCGKVFCGKCTAYRVVINGSLKRACSDCYRIALSDTSRDVGFRRVGNAETEEQTQAQSQQNTFLRSTSAGKVQPDKQSANNRLQLSMANSAEVNNSILPPLVFAIIAIGSGDLSVSPPTVQAVYPEQILSQSTLEEIVQMSIPANLCPDFATQLTFMFRSRCRAYSNSVDLDDDKNCGDNLGLLNGFVCFSQRSVDGAAYQQAIVLLSHWAIPQLAFQILFKLDEIYFMNISFQQQAAKHQQVQTIDRIRLLAEIADNAISVAEMEFNAWPVSSKPQELPFFGENIQFTLPMPVVDQYHPYYSLNFEGMNLISLLGPLGLLQHILSLWALVIAGESVLILATSRSQCSEVAVALSTLVRPMIYRGDLRPCIVNSSPDCVSLGRLARDQELVSSTGKASPKRGSPANMNSDILAVSRLRGPLPEELVTTTSHMKEKSRVVKELPRGVLLGTEDASLLQTFNRFTAVIFLPPPEICLELDSLRKGLATKSAADVVKLEAKDSFIKCMDQWIGKGSKKAIFATRKSPSDLLGGARKNDSELLIRRIREMSTRERTVLGDKLIRDTLANMTTRYVKSFIPSTDDPATALLPPLPSSSSSMIPISTLLRRRRNGEYSTDDLKNQDISPPMKPFVEEIASRVVQSFCFKSFPWFLYYTAAGFLLLSYLSLGFSPYLVVTALYVGYIPIDPPSWIIFCFSRSKEPDGQICILETLNQVDGDATDTEESKEEIIINKESAEQRVDMSGVWKREKCVNVDSYVGAQGAGFLQRKLAASTSMTHTITMDTTLSAVRIQEKAGPIDTDYTLVVGDSPKNSEVMKRIFKDRMYWQGNKMVVHRILETGEYELILTRHMDGPRSIVLSHLHRDLKSGVETVATSWFSLQKPSPNPPLPTPTLQAVVSGGSTTSQCDDDEASLCEAGRSSGINRPDFTGVWRRTNTSNYESFIGAQGAGFVQRKLAASMALTHTIDMTDSSLRLREVGGPLNKDTFYDIGSSSWIETEIVKRKFKEKCFWEGEVIVIHRIHILNDFELILKRYLEDAGRTVRLVSLHRNLGTGQEVEAISMFSKSK